MRHTVCVYTFKTGSDVCVLLPVEPDVTCAPAVEHNPGFFVLFKILLETFVFLKKVNGHWGKGNILQL